MWPNDFPSRLQEWHDLREHASTMDQESALEAINNWWFRAPMTLHYLHPADDLENWPNPWELLSDNYYCDIARGLGIMYTIYSVENLKNLSVEMIITDQDELIFVRGKTKYTLNLGPGPIVNIPSRDGNIRYRIHGKDIKHKLEQFEV